MSKPIPKSLHTVTVLIRMAGLIKELLPQHTNTDAVYAALDTLGYGDGSTFDGYGLAALAIRAMERGQ